MRIGAERTFLREHKSAAATKASPHTVLDETYCTQHWILHSLSCKANAYRDQEPTGGRKKRKAAAADFATFRAGA